MLLWGAAGDKPVIFVHLMVSQVVIWTVKMKALSAIIGARRRSDQQQPAPPSRLASKTSPTNI